MGELAEAKGGAIYCPFANGACRLAQCPWLHENTVQACMNVGTVEKVLLLLTEQDFIVEGLSIRCGICGTLDGHGNVPGTGETCPKRFGTIRINHL